VYEAHFGLRRRPFVETVDPSAYVPLRTREAALRRLRFGLEAGGGAVLAYGPPGAGKTILARRLAAMRGGPAVILPFPALAPEELLAWLADELGAPNDPAPGRAGSIRRLRGALEQAAARGARPLLVVDDAHLLDPETLETLRLLLNFASDGSPDLAVALVGGTELLLRLPASLGDRLAGRCLVGVLEEEESAAYLHGRLAGAGAARDLFDPEALPMLHHAADGLPRRLNRLAETALLIAYEREADRVGPEVVALAVGELDDPYALAG
jgi:MSHA biogenesis protein MshM